MFYWAYGGRIFPRQRPRLLTFVSFLHSDPPRPAIRVKRYDVHKEHVYIYRDDQGDVRGANVTVYDFQALILSFLLQFWLKSHAPTRVNLEDLEVDGIAKLQHCDLIDVGKSRFRFEHRAWRFIGPAIFSRDRFFHLPLRIFSGLWLSSTTPKGAASTDGGLDEIEIQEES